MSLEQWVDNGWLRPHKTSATEVTSIMAVVERDLVDAQGQISADWRFGIAYNAAFNLCAVLLHASGYRAEKDLQHCPTTDALPLILYYRKDDAEYLEACRAKWIKTQDEIVGAATEKDVSELLEYVKELREDVLYWLQQCHPHLTPSKSS